MCVFFRIDKIWLWESVEQICYGRTNTGCKIKWSTTAIRITVPSLSSSSCPHPLMYLHLSVQTEDMWLAAGDLCPLEASSPHVTPLWQSHTQYYWTNSSVFKDRHAMFDLYMIWLLNICHPSVLYELQVLLAFDGMVVVGPVIYRQQWCTCCNQKVY